VLNILAQANAPEKLADYLPAAIASIERSKRDLRAGRVPLEDLVVRQKLSRTLDGYRSPSPAARAARQLQAIGREVAPGQSIEFLFTRDGVHAWALGETFDVRRLDVKRYCALLDRAMGTVLDPCRGSLSSGSRLF